MWADDGGTAPPIASDVVQLWVIVEEEEEEEMRELAQLPLQFDSRFRVSGRFGDPERTEILLVPILGQKLIGKVKEEIDVFLPIN